MKMPDSEGIAGQISACKYIKGNNEEETQLEPSAVYVERGTPEGTLHAQKVFQGYRPGTAPTGISLAGIKFKIINTDTDEPLVIDGQTTKDFRERNKQFRR